MLAKAGKSKDICANVDLYSGCVYSALGIPRELLADLRLRPHGRLERAPLRGNRVGQAHHAPGL